jgi:hypothetical protein
LTVGKGEDLEQIPKGHDASNAYGTEGKTLEKGAAVNFLGHL